MSDDLRPPDQPKPQGDDLISRRSLIPILGAGALAGWAGLRLEKSERRPDGRSSVTIVKASNYSAELAQRIRTTARSLKREVGRDVPSPNRHRQKPVTR